MTDTCPNCSAAIKGGFLPNAAVSDRTVAYINALADTPVEGACEKCSLGLQAGAEKAFALKLATARAALRQASLTMPLTSIPAPPGWDFGVAGLVTAQSVTGTGVFSDVTSAFTDLFGTQSGAYNQKLRAGEDLCKASLKAQAVELSANAIVGIDVDYAEVGGQRAMLMVCMTGTAVRLRNPDVVSPDFATDAPRLNACRAKLFALLATATAQRVQTD